jgi:pimeloyl-ACP methyl ester carboxylesterase
LPFVEVEKGKLYYDEQGAGRPLILIHGAWTSHKWWRWQVPELSRSYKVICIDVRGHGRSSSLDEAYSIKGFAADLETFRQGLDIQKTAFIGWSLVGFIDLQYCLDYPAKVNSLVLLATRGHRNPKLKLRAYLIYLHARLNLMMALSQPRKYDRLKQSFPSPGFESINKQVKAMLSPAASKEVYDWIVADLKENPRNNFFEVLKSLWNWEAGKRLDQISAPTLIMVGEHDTWTPPHFSRLMHQSIAASKLTIVKDAGHCIALEKPQVVNEEILNFLKSIGY